MRTNKLLSYTFRRKNHTRETGSRYQVIERMLRRLLSSNLFTTAPRLNDDERTTSSTPGSSSLTWAKPHFTPLPLILAEHNTRTHPATTDDDTRVPSRPIMSQNKLKVDPTMADSWSLHKDARLNREYTLIDNDDPDEQDYDVIPNIKTTLVEKNPRRPPHPLDNYANDRSYIRKLAERMDYWVTDPTARLRGGKQRTPGERSDEHRAIDAAAWIDGVKSDIRCLWDNMGVGQDFLDEELQCLRVAFFHECRRTLEKVEEEGFGVSLARVQDEIRSLLVSHDLKLSGEGIQIMREMATEKRVLRNRYNFTLDEQREINRISAQMVGQLSRWEYFVLRKRLLSEMPPERRMNYARRDLDVVCRYFNNRVMKSFAMGKELMEPELTKFVTEEKERSRKQVLEELGRQQKQLEGQVESLREELERQKRRRA